MAKYEVIITDPDAGTIWEVIPKSYSFTDKLNKEPEADFTFSFEEMQNYAELNGTTVINMFTAALREIYINRDGSKIFYGVISDFEVNPGDEGEKNIVIKAIGFFGLFKKRLVGIGVETNYSGQDAGAIAWDLLEDSQASDSPYSDWGITEGSITTSKNRDRSYLFDNVYESIIRLSNENLADGFDFDIDNTKQFNVYYPTKGQARPNVVFDARTMATWKYQKKLFSEMVNKVYVIGEGFNEEIAYETRTAGTSYRTPFGTLEEKIEARDVTEVATLQDKGDKRLAEAREPRVIIDSVKHYDISPILYTDYNVGDTVTVNLPELGVSNVSKRVMERKFTMKSPESVVEITVKLDV